MATGPNRSIKRCFYLPKSLPSPGSSSHPLNKIVKKFLQDINLICLYFYVDISIFDDCHWIIIFPP